MDQSMQQAQVIIKGLGLKRDVTMPVISWSGILALAEVGPGWGGGGGEGRHLPPRKMLKINK